MTSDPLKRIRVLLAGMPPLMLDILSHVVASEPDMMVVGVIEGGNLLAATLRARADVVVVGQKTKAESKEYVMLLRQQPHLKVLAVGDDGKTGSLYELRPRRIPLGEVSARTLSRAIRGRRAPRSSIGPAARKPLEVD